jgi:hypothetical protein
LQGIVVRVHPSLGHVSTSILRELKSEAAYAISRLPSTISTVSIEIVPHWMLNGHDQSWGYMAVASGSNRILLSDKLLEIPKDNRRLHLFHEVWHLHEDLQFQLRGQRFETGFHEGSNDAWRFAYECFQSFMEGHLQSRDLRNVIFSRGSKRCLLGYLDFCISRIRYWLSRLLRPR